MFNAVVDYFRANRTRSLGAAVFTGCLFVFLIVFLVGKKTDRRGSGEPVIGSVSALSGKADGRFLSTVSFGALKSGDSLRSGELVTVHEASQMTLTFSGGATVRLQPGARLVAEKDSSQAMDAVLATLLDGDADVLAQGAPGTFRLMKSGRDITATGTVPAQPTAVIVGPGARVFTGPQAARDVVIAATTPAETATPVPQAPTRMSDERGGTISGDSLSNDEIRRALANESGFYRRCYLTYLNRVPKNSPAASTVTVGFVIANSGKVRDAKIVRSDFMDAILNNCVLETVERTPFRAFKGSDIPVLEFPIELK